MKTTSVVTELGFSMWLVLLWCTFFLAPPCLAHSVSYSPRVATSLGPVEGQVLKSRCGKEYFAFTGIPYAEMPVGCRRFMPPEPAKKWEGVLNATKDPVMCFQAMPYYMVPCMGQEDCLYLNIYTPKHISSPLPVMVWIHGGRFAYGFPGSSKSTRYFMDQDIITASVSFRLGNLGFLSLEDETIPGNMGLKDIALALEWLNREISNFGGDPDSIIVFGQSSGAVLAHFICSIPRTARLVESCISQSGTGDASWALKQRGTARKEALNLASALGCTENDLLPCLQSKSVEEVGNQTLLRSCDFRPSTPVLESPTSPGAILTEWPSRIRDFPWITGINQEEGLTLTAYYEFQCSKEEREKFIQGFNTTLINHLRLFNQSNQNETIRKIWERFQIDCNPLIGIRNYYSEAFFIYPALKSLSQHEGPKYFYVFNYTGGPTYIRPSDPNSVPGVSHTDELPYLLDLIFANVPPNWPSQKDLLLSQSMIKMWTSFAKVQTPTVGSNGNWTQFADGDYLRMDNKCFRMEKSSNYHSIISFWNSIFHC